jgi:transcriptional regulator of met regulon
VAEFEQTVFSSYARGGKREEIVNQIDEAIQMRWLKIIRDNTRPGIQALRKQARCGQL